MQTRRCPESQPGVPRGHRRRVDMDAGDVQAFLLLWSAAIPVVILTRLPWRGSKPLRWYRMALSFIGVCVVLALGAAVRTDRAGVQTFQPWIPAVGIVAVGLLAGYDRVATVAVLVLTILGVHLDT